ncbi:MAG: dephospho-CoA kinase [Candidatus Nanopelagicales bacterium]|nr:dephospho-CoA kinase [Candidatus Nanopelagicales bacterium]
MRRVGLTGGIGSGKSTVASLLKERGATVIDADAIARQGVEPGSETLAELVAEFGHRILREDGSLNRGELAAVAFADRIATERLNEIMHPAIKAETARLLEAAGDAAIVIHDMPLLLETGQQDLVDIVVVVDVPEDVQRERAVGQRGLSLDDVERRMAAQVMRSERLARADVVIDNSGTRENTARQVDSLWERLTQAS